MERGRVRVDTGEISLSETLLPVFIISGWEGRHPSESSTGTLSLIYEGSPVSLFVTSGVMSLPRRLP